jgi:hypothetical protein
MRSTLAILVVGGCAAAPRPAPTPPGSRGMRASEHLEAARQQDELAQQALAYPDVRAGARFGEPPFATPWTRTWDTRVDHERLAQIHRSTAAQLQAEYAEACAGRGAAETSTSPIARFAIGGTPTANGVTIYLSADAGEPEHLLADMRCHRAWMMLAPSGMDDCPLDLADIHVTARGTLEEIEVTITVSDPALVGELQRRTTRDLEHAEHEHHGAR